MHRIRTTHAAHTSRHEGLGEASLLWCSTMGTYHHLEEVSVIYIEVKKTNESAVRVDPDPDLAPTSVGRPRLSCNQPLAISVTSPRRTIGIPPWTGTAAIMVVEEVVRALEHLQQVYIR